MDFFILILLISNAVWESYGNSLRDQLEHAERRQEDDRVIIDLRPKRRYFDFHPGRSTIIGSPAEPSHLPEAEPILPGHTLIRPALDMLRSAIKFPHRDLEDGSGVYGNIDNLGIRYDGKNERVLYSGFRRKDNHKSNILPKDDSIEYRTMFIDSVPRSLRNIIEAILLSIRKENEIKESRKIKVPRRLKKRQANQMYYLRSNPDSAKLKKLGGGSGRLKPSGGIIGSDEAHATRHSQHVVTSSSEEAEDRKPGDSNHHEHSDEFDGQKKHASDHLIVKMDPKKTWFWNSMNVYNYKQINQEAPDINELTPPLKYKNKRHWWYYHEGDFRPFDSE